MESDKIRLDVWDSRKSQRSRYGGPAHKIKLHASADPDRKDSRFRYCRKDIKIFPEESCDTLIFTVGGWGGWSSHNRRRDYILVAGG